MLWTYWKRCCPLPCQKHMDIFSNLVFTWGPDGPSEGKAYERNSLTWASGIFNLWLVHTWPLAKVGSYIGSSMGSCFQNWFLCSSISLDFQCGYLPCDFNFPTDLRRVVDFQFVQLLLGGLPNHHFQAHYMLREETDSDSLIRRKEDLPQKRKSLETLMTRMLEKGVMVVS